MNFELSIVNCECESIQNSAFFNFQLPKSESRIKKLGCKYSTFS